MLLLVIFCLSSVDSPCATFFLWHYCSVTCCTYICVRVFHYHIQLYVGYINREVCCFYELICCRLIYVFLFTLSLWVVLYTRARPAVFLYGIQVPLGYIMWKISFLYHVKYMIWRLLLLHFHQRVLLNHNYEEVHLFMIFSDSWDMSSGKIFVFLFIAAWFNVCYLYCLKCFKTRIRKICVAYFNVSFFYSAYVYSLIWLECSLIHSFFMRALLMICTTAIVAYLDHFCIMHFVKLLVDVCLLCPSAVSLAFSFVCLLCFPVFFSSIFNSFFFIFHLGFLYIFSFALIFV